MSRPPRGPTAERMVRRAQELRAEHLMLRAHDAPLLECARAIREAEWLEQQVRSVQMKDALRDGRMVKVALENPGLTIRDLEDRFGVHHTKIDKVLSDAGVEHGPEGWRRKVI